MCNVTTEMDEWRQNFLGSSPMFEPLRKVGALTEKRDRWPTLDELNALLVPAIQTASGIPIKFVPQAGKPGHMEEKYEARIYLTGEVQTRTENWHDLFNALVWLAFPRVKAAINAKHFEFISRHGEGNRGKIQDALTLFDESGVIVVCPDGELAGLLRDFQWRELFWERRQAVKEQMKFVLFGHSLYEKALQPYLGFTGKGFLAEGGELFNSPVEQLDTLMAARVVRGELFGSSAFTPVPLLGVPGWWSENDDSRFYENKDYFRTQRRGAEKPLVIQ